ncbi:MAG TPA: hypothetical protein VHV83_04345, partial [Armatimonadota bacterium]|nr:hypothetical protein [Armatimonadota bacterium]
ITKFSVNERRVWSKSFNEIIDKNTYTSIEKKYDISILSQFYKLTLGADNTISAEIVGWSKSNNKTKSLAVLLNKDGKLIGSLPSFGVTGGEKWWRVDLPENVVPFFSTISVKSISQDGQVAQTFGIPIIKDNAHFNDFLPDGGVNVLPDSHGGFALLTLAPCQVPVQITPIEVIKSDIVVSWYDNKGSFIEQFRFPSTPFISTACNIAFAGDGTIYYLRFGSTGLDLMSHAIKTDIGGHYHA